MNKKRRSQGFSVRQTMNRWTDCQFYQSHFIQVAQTETLQGRSRHFATSDEYIHYDVREFSEIFNLTLSWLKYLNFKWKPPLTWEQKIKTVMFLIKKKKKRNCIHLHLRFNYLHSSFLWFDSGLNFSWRKKEKKEFAAWAQHVEYWLHQAVALISWSRTSEALKKSNQEDFFFFIITGHF